MTDTKELLQRIAALRQRLDISAGAAPSTSLQAPAITTPLKTMEDKVARGSLHNAMIDNTLRAAEGSDPTQTTTTPARLTARGSRLIRKGRELLQALRTISDDPEFQKLEQFDPLLYLHREVVASLEVLMRTVQLFPSAVSAQLRMCDGLEVVLRDAEERVTLLCASLVRRKREITQITELSDYLWLLATNQPVQLTSIQALADMVIADARMGLPLHFAYASPQDPARFAAAHGLTVAHVLARILLGDHEWEKQLQLAITAALVHDVGMVRVPSELLLLPRPFDTDQRRLMEKHVLASQEILSPLWPGGGWPIEAATHHHERADGTGYPSGQRLLEQSPLVRLLAVCDVYAAMCAARPHRPALDSRLALTEILFLSERDFLDRKAAERLLVLGFYPTGSTVELNDGSTAIVIATHTDRAGLTNPGRPVVHLLTDAQGHPFAMPTVIDLLEHPERSIVRSLPVEDRQALLGKKYPQLI